MKMSLWISTGSFLIFRQSVSPDPGIPADDIAVAHRIVLVSLDDFDKGTMGAHYDSYMVRPSGRISQGADVPVIVDDIAWEGKVAVTFLPASQVLPKTDLPLAAALGGDEICKH